MIKRIFIFLLALILCWGPAATVVYTQAQDGEPVAGVVDTEKSTAGIENSDEPDDGAESPEPSDTDSEDTEESADRPDNGDETPEPSDTDSEDTEESADKPDNGAETSEPSDANSENTEESADEQDDDGEHKEQDSGEDSLNETQSDGADQQDAEEPGENPDGVDIEPEPIDGEKRLEETADEDIVYTEEELYDWCSEHRSSGGQVTLGDSITITDNISISIDNGQIVIDTGQYGIVYDGGCISLMGDLEIIGEGVDIPVLDIQTVIHYGYYWESSWNDAVQALNITAVGRDGTGGIAVRVRQEDGYSPRYINYNDEGLIRSYGTGAIGLYLDEPDDAYCLQIEVEGDDSTAVYAPQGANLYYCKLTAEGAGASVVSGSGEIVVDTCATSPEPLDVQVVNYRIAGVSGSRLYYPVQQYGDIDSPDCYITFLLSTEDGYPFVTQTFLIDWQLTAIDTGVLGQTTIQGHFELPFQGLGLEEDFPLEFTVEVRDPDIPCISDILFNKDWELGAYVFLAFWDTYEREDENVILWRSDDGGVTWYDFTDSDDIWWSGSSMIYYYGKIYDTVMLQLEVFGKELSNIVSIYPFDGKVYSGLGGDRDGGDRNIIDWDGSDRDDGDRDDYDRDGDNQNGDDRDGDDQDDDDQDGNGRNGDDAGRLTGNGDSSVDGNSTGGYSDIPDTSVPASSALNEYGLILVFADADIIEETATAKTETTAVSVEWENRHTIAISGRRLTAMAEANPKAVTFIKNGIQISVLSADLLALGLDENQLFLVEIKKLTGNSFSVLFRTDDIELSVLPFTAYIGETVFDGILLASAVCVNENGDVLPSEYDPGTGKLSVSMTSPGIFTLQGTQLSKATAVLVPDNSEVPEQDGQPGKASSPLNAGMIVVGISAIFLPAGSFVWRKRRLARR